VLKLGRDIKHWEVWRWIKDRIDAFKKTMPLVADLRNPAMRPRHWQQLMETIQTPFDPASNSFTLDSIVQLRLDQHAEFIGEMSVNATKELAIEQSITAIAETWKTLDLDMVRFCRVSDHSCIGFVKRSSLCGACAKASNDLSVDVHCAG
jgi:dynein heavy chain, axonemal